MRELRGLLRELGDLLRELWSERRRLLLVVLGLAWGTVGLAVLLGFGDGMHVAMNAALRASGDRLVRVYNGATRLPYAGLPAGRRVNLTIDDARSLAQVPGVGRISIELINQARLRADRGGVQANAAVHGVDPEFGELRGLWPRPGGRFCHAADVAERRRVVFLGDALSRRLFGSTDSVGRTVQIWDQPFTVIGVMAAKASMMNYNGQDDVKAFVPWSSFQAVRAYRYVSFALLECSEPDRHAEVAVAVRQSLARRKQFDPADPAGIGLVDQVETVSSIRSVIALTRLFLLVVGAIGLLVAAVGTANMMFVAVEDRVAEIGLLLAVGASPRQIRRRHLLEAGCVVGIGGGLGLLLSALLLFAIEQLPLPPEAQLYLGRPQLSVPAALAVAGLLGLCAAVAGWHPAARAAAVQPVEALRHE